MSLKKSIVAHPHWGRIIVTRNPMARRIIMRACPDAIHMTVPTYATVADIDKALEQCGGKLQRAQEVLRQKTTIDNLELVCSFLHIRKVWVLLRTAVTLSPSVWA